MPQKIVIFLPYFHIIYIFLHVFVSAWRSVPAREKSMPSEWKASSTHHVVLFHGENTVSMLWMWIWICPLNLLTISLDNFQTSRGSHLVSSWPSCGTSRLRRCLNDTNRSAIIHIQMEKLFLGVPQWLLSALLSFLSLTQMGLLAVFIQCQQHNTFSPTRREVEYQWITGGPDEFSA